MDSSFLDSSAPYPTSLSLNLVCPLTMKSALVFRLVSLIGLLACSVVADPEVLTHNDVSAATDPSDHTCGRIRAGKNVGNSCGPQRCCSKWGYCGTGEGYCGEGCQLAYGICGVQRTSTTTGKLQSTSTSRKTTTSAVPSGGSMATCGKASNLKCADGLCCSSFGHCGNSTNFCGVGCQPNYGTCDPVSTSIRSSTSSGFLTTSKRSSQSISSSTSSLSHTLGGQSMPTGSMPTGSIHPTASIHSTGSMQTTKGTPPQSQTKFSTTTKTPSSTSRGNVPSGSVRSSKSLPTGGQPSISQPSGTSIPSQSQQPTGNQPTGTSVSSQPQPSAATSYGSQSVAASTSSGSQPFTSQSIASSISSGNQPTRSLSNGVKPTTSSKTGGIQPTPGQSSGTRPSGSTKTSSSQTHTTSSAPKTTPHPSSSSHSTSTKTSSTCSAIMTESGFERSSNLDGSFYSPPWVVYKTSNGTFNSDTSNPKGGNKDLILTTNGAAGYGILSQLIIVNYTTNYNVSGYVNFPAGGACSFAWTFQIVNDTSSTKTLISASNSGSKATGYVLYSSSFSTNYDNSGVRPTQGQIFFHPQCANSGQTVYIVP